MDVSIFEPYLVYDENGEITGLKKDAPVELKLEFTQWFEQQKDQKRLHNTYHNQ